MCSSDLEDVACKWVLVGAVTWVDVASGVNVFVVGCGSFVAAAVVAGGCMVGLMSFGSWLVFDSMLYGVLQLKIFWASSAVALYGVLLFWMS